MAKANTVKVVATAAPAPVVQYLVLQPKRPLSTTSKHGIGGTAGTHAALVAAAAANGGTLTLAQAKAACAGNGDADFAGYAVRSKWLVPQSSMPNSK